MRIRFKKAILFFSILFIILILMNQWMDRELNPHYPLQYGEVFHPKVKADVIILGASHATHGINPKYLERDRFRVYNFSLNGAGPLFNLTWYKKIFRHHYPQPLYVIYAVHWIMFDDQLLKRTFEQDSHYFPLHFFLKELKEFKTAQRLLLNRFALIRERKHLAGRLFQKIFREVYLPSKYYNGFIPFERRGTLDEEERVNPKNSPAQIKAFEELLDALGRDGVKVIFVHLPGYLPGRGDSNISEGMQLLNKISREREIPFLNYETEKISEINTDKTLFSDIVHLNEKGSDRISSLLRIDLERFLR
jgi:hypothetical protein